MLGGQRLIDRMAGWARRHSDAVALSVRAGGQDWGTGLPLLTDPHVGIGPISALASAMEGASAMRRSHVLLIGCDMPFLPDNLIPRLISAICGAGAAVPESGGYLHPLAALWRVDVAAVERYIAAGGQSVRRFAETVGLVRVAWDLLPDPFANINDAALLAKAEARFRDGAP
ncbi:MAG: molybdenum cofactor guanylyltransferase [Sphingomonadales bacterium]|nr:molybdenum cofactor guanylyltransferase [Sphingomonadales bacterium]